MEEFRLLSRVFEHNAALGERVLIPPGDDMGMVRVGGCNLLAAVDQVIAGRHVQLETTPLFLVGRKAVARSLSDIAAMAAKPVASLATVILPADFSEADALELFDGMRETAAQYHAPLIGGDVTSGAGPLSMTVTVLAEPGVGGVGGAGGVVRRDGAQVGDAVYVSGLLGGAWRSDSPDAKHLTFEPRIDLALALAERFPLHAMIDISDGLGRDLNHIAQMSGVAARLEMNRVPCSPDSDWMQAISDGEDYELCFTVPNETKIPPEIDGVPLTHIGMIEALTDGQPRTAAMIDGCLVDLSSSGWEHGQ